MGNVLIIDDEEKLRSLLGRIIQQEGFNVFHAGDRRSALKMMQTQPLDIVLCDVRLPDGNGVELIKEMKEKFPDTIPILLTAYGNIQDGIQAMKNGAFDYLIKGDDNNRIIPLLQRAMETIKLSRKVKRLEKQIEKKYSFKKIIGRSKAIKDAISLAERVAGTDATVLLLGETGTGKEVFAQSIHASSNRASQSFVAINCSAFSTQLLESELFGYMVGAFTGADKEKRGLLEEAHQGTLFLDEIGEMDIILQAKLLRMLETGEFIKVGGTKPVRVDVRIIAATNRDLEKASNSGEFRADLYYRLAVFQIHLPPLRERKEDIADLTNHFVKLFTGGSDSMVHPSISAGYIQLLESYSWKGNIRELRNVVERSVILCDGPELLPEHLPSEIFRYSPLPKSFENEDLSLATYEKHHISQVLLHSKGNKAEAARLLKIGVATLYRKIEEYGLK